MFVSVHIYVDCRTGGRKSAKRSRCPTSNPQGKYLQVFVCECECKLDFPTNVHAKIDIHVHPYMYTVVVYLCFYV